MKNVLKLVLGSFTLITAALGQPVPSDFTLKELGNYVNQPLNCQSLSCSSISQMNLVGVNWSTRELKISFMVQARVLSTTEIPINLNGLTVKALKLNGREWQSATKTDSRLSVVTPEGRHSIEVTLGFTTELIAMELLEKPKNFLSEVTNATAKIGSKGGNYILTINNTTEVAQPKDQVNTASLLETLPKKPVFIVSHTLYLERTWKLKTTVYPVPGAVVSQPVPLEIPLISGEKVLNEEYKAEGGKIYLMATNNPISWESIVPVQTQIKIPALSGNLLEQFNVFAQKEWLYSFKGLNPVSQGTPAGYKSSSQWLLWPRDELIVQFSHPAALPGSTNAVNNYKLDIQGTVSPLSYQFNFDYITSMGGRSYVGIPKGFTLDTIQVNGKVIPGGMEGDKLALDLLGKKNHVTVILKKSEDLVGLVTLPQLTFDTTVVNQEYTLNTANKWVLLAGGANVHPAILLWGILISLSLFSIVLSKTKLTPYHTFTWILLFLGLSQAGILGCVVMIITLLLFGAKGRFLSYGYLDSRGAYNALQIVLIGLTFITVVTVLATLKQGLLDNPEIFISGLGSHGNHLYWYAENNTAGSPWVIFLPIWVYRVLMFIWAMWFAAKSISLIQWMWERLNEDSLWIKYTKPLEDEIIVTSDEEISVQDEINKGELGKE